MSGLTVVDSSNFIVNSFSGDINIENNNANILSSVSLI